MHTTFHVHADPNTVTHHLRIRRQYLDGDSGKPIAGTYENILLPNDLIISFLNDMAPSALSELFDQAKEFNNSGHPPITFDESNIETMAE